MTKTKKQDYQNAFTYAEKALLNQHSADIYLVLAEVYLFSEKISESEKVL